MDGRMTPKEELFEAVNNRRPDEIRNLLRRAADIASMNEDGDTILHLAAWKGQEDVVEVLIRADKWEEIVNIKDDLGRTALHNCCMRGHTETVKLLLKNRADATATDQEGWTALHHAADEGYLEVVRCLAEHMEEREMDFNLKTNKTGGTALHIAADRGFPGIVRELMRKGASSTTTAWDGETVLHWALESAVTAGYGINDEDEAGHEAHDNDLNDEIVDFDDRHIVRFIGPYQEERAKEIPEQYDAVFERILENMDGKTKWSELLKVTCREERMETLRCLMSKMYPQEATERLQRPLRRIWLAMSEARTRELTKMLRREAREARTEELLQIYLAETREPRTQELIQGLRESARDNTETMEEWDILSLATTLGKVQTLYWLLRNRRWSKSDIDRAKNLPRRNRLNRNAIWPADGEIWNTPFVHNERIGRERYRWPKDDQDRPNLDRFGVTIMDFHKVDNQIDSIYYNCDTSSLIHRGEDHGPKKTMEKTMGSLKSQGLGEVVTDEYSDANRCYRWIHLAINSIPWMKDLAMISYLEKDAKREEWMATWQFLQRSWQELPENRDEESYMRPNCLRANLSQSKSKSSEQLTTSEHDESVRLALYMPYLTYGPFENTPHDENLPVEHKGGILHRSRTLDQFYHSIQDDNRARDKDQVFTRYFDWKLGRERAREDTGFNILRVNQLWLWVIDESTVITSTTHGLDESEDRVFQGLLKRLCQSQTMFNREATPLSIDSLVKIITSFYINALNNLKVPLKVPSTEAIRGDLGGPTKTYTASLKTVFADSIDYNNQKEKLLLRKFRIAMNDKTTRSEDLNSLIIQTMNTLGEIKDIRDELNMINSVVQEQSAVWSQLLNQSCGSSTRNDAPEEGYKSYRGSSTDPDAALKQTKDLLQKAEEAEHNITSFIELHLGLEINQLNLSEAQEARMQGKILMVFTIVTVIFLPLSFLSSLFALNISKFPHSGNDVQYQPGWIFGIMFGATVAFILLLLPFTVFQEAFSGTILKVIRKSQELIRKASRPTGPERDETRRTAGGNGRKSLKEWWQQLWRRWRRTNSGRERSTLAAAQRGPGDPPV